jgi:G3E family GTPase
MRETAAERGHMPGTRILLFTGFLGSGKTTLILAVARVLAEMGRRTCIIVNEIGDVGIDGEVLRLGGLDVREITAGCICCQMGVDLIRTLQEVVERVVPDLVMIEASGMATPAGVMRSLDRYSAGSVSRSGRANAADPNGGDLSGGASVAGPVVTITVVDPTRFEALHEVLTPLIEDQIAGADRVVVTKALEATPEEVDGARRVIQALRPGVPLHVTDSLRPESVAPLVAALVGSGCRS